MSDIHNDINKFADLLDRYRSGIIAIQSNPSVDGLAAATSLYLALSKMNKNVTIVCSQPPQNQEIVGTDKIQSELSSGGNHLVISFPYHEGAIDKVDYNIQGDQFNLIIIPNSETNRIDPNEVKFSYTGGKIEFVITVDVPNLNSLGNIYTNNQNEFQSKNIINIDRHLINSSFGTVNIINKQAAATSEMIFQIIKQLQIEIDKDIASNLYTGLLAATNNFSSHTVGPTTFEAAAQLMKYGAAKKPQPGQAGPGGPGSFGGGGFPPPGGMGGGMPPSNPFGGGNPFGQNPFGAGGNQPQAPRQGGPQQPRPNPFGFMNPNQAGAPGQQQPPQQSPAPSFPQHNQNQQQQQPQHVPVQQPQQQPAQQNQPQQNQAQQSGDQSNQRSEQSNEPSDQKQDNAQDWLKPKLFRGSNLM